MTDSYTANLGPVSLEHPLMNAAGCCKTVEDVREFVRSAVSAILVGSITVEPRLGNGGDVYHQDAGWSVNALGMPNRGLGYFAQHLDEMLSLAHIVDKPLGVSVAGFSPVEYADLVLACDSADFLELNLGCPNVWADGVQKRIVAFDPEQVQAVLDAVFDMQPACPVGVKVSPYSDPYLLADVAAVLADSPVAYVAAVNTFPNALALTDSGSQRLTVGFGGLSGPAMLPVGLGQVQQLRSALPAHISVIGVGGVTEGRDILAYQAAGASAVQAASAYWNAGENPAAYSRLLDSLLASI